jgi:predicted nucleotidyltransferase
VKEATQQFVRELAELAGANLRSVLLYGSAASGEFHTRHSDVNLLCLFDQLDAATLARIGPLIRRWTRRAGAAPLVFSVSELARSADVFAVELVDIKAMHAVLHGEDLVATLDVPLRFYNLQVERELRQNLVRLREHFLAGDGRNSTLLALMTASISSFTTLFRHAAVALGTAPPGGESGKSPGKREAVDRLAALVGFDAKPFHVVLDVREGKVADRKVDAPALFHSYLAAVTRVVDEVDQRLDERTGA